VLAAFELQTVISLALVDVVLYTDIALRLFHATSALRAG
jgi:hypothetical protein